MSTLAGRVALVTGGAHRVGRGIALALAAAGADVAIHYNASAGPATATVATLEALGQRALAVQADLADPAAVAPLFERVLAHFGRLDVLVNSAAIMERVDVLAMTVAQWDRTLNTNLRAPFLCSQIAGRHMLAAGGGAIINISDVAGLEPWPSYAHHSASKAGLIMLTRVFARALAPSVRVNAVAPGPVAKPQGWDDPRWEAVWGKLPLKRAGTAEDVGEAVVYLAGARFVTGTVLVVDGGDSLI